MGIETRRAAGGDDLEKWRLKDVKAQEVPVTRMEDGPLTHITYCGSANGKNRR